MNGQAQNGQAQGGMNALMRYAPIVVPQAIIQTFPAFEITLLEKFGGPLTKAIKLGDDGRLISDGSACVMSSGIARRCPVESLTGFAGLSPAWRRTKPLPSDRSGRTCLTSLSSARSASGKASARLAAATWSPARVTTSSMRWTVPRWR